MNTVCPFCKMPIPMDAIVCPHCTRDTRDLESVFGPASPGRHARRVRDDAREFCRGIGIVLGFCTAYYFGLSWWLIGLLTVAGALVGETIGCWLFGDEV